MSLGTGVYAACRSKPRRRTALRPAGSGLGDQLLIHRIVNNSATTNADSHPYLSDWLYAATRGRNRIFGALALDELAPVQSRSRTT